MARTSTLSKLPSDLRGYINTQLRQNQYMCQEDIRAWLKERGYEVSKSALNRYSMALRRNDGNEGKTSLELVTNEADPALSRKDSILLELGKLKVKETLLLDELRDLSR